MNKLRKFKDNMLANEQDKKDEKDTLKAPKGKLELCPTLFKPKGKIRKTFNTPQKLLQPVTYHILYGDVAVFDHIYPEDYMSKGITSILNYSKIVNEIIIDRAAKKLTITLFDKDNNDFSRWRLLVDRLKTLSDKDAFDLANQIEDYSLKIETKSKNEIIASEDSVLPVENLDISQKQYDEALRSFISQNKIKFYVAWECRRDFTGAVKVTKFHMDETLLYVLGYNMEDLYFKTLRKGIPELFCASQYYHFWTQSPLFFDGIERSNLKLEVELLDSDGKRINAYVCRYHNLTMNLGRTGFNTFIVSIDFEPSVLERIMKLRQKKGLRKDVEGDIEEEDSLNYKRKCEEFHDYFYKESGFIPKNQRLGSSKKVCTFKDIVPVIGKNEGKPSLLQKKEHLENINPE